MARFQIQFGDAAVVNVNAPQYVFLISDLAGEQRFASTVAKRLESLGALTHGDRRATETRDLSRFNIDTKMGREALDIVMRACINGDPSIVEPPSYGTQLGGSLDDDFEGGKPSSSLSDSSDTTALALRSEHFFADVKASLQGKSIRQGVYVYILISISTNITLVASE
ncbi:unnamed protein product [Protopolystoma xenopodis]|uniref:Strawberry notch helicase C domain-containing protein n=1 Tax=Protopolystoma xenopodis TaxID=117903 RepID=A0A3S5CEA6_9PLAT|nr:unnamed protein product [Protopolystoma xenopodis]